VTSWSIAREPRASTVSATFAEAAWREIVASGYVVVPLDDGTGCASPAAPVRDWSGAVRFALHVIGSQSTSGAQHDDAAVAADAARATVALGSEAAGY